jgi:hypothetical protein
MVFIASVIGFCVGWGLCAAHAVAREAASRDDPHVYLSTACYHERHPACRHFCAFCRSVCTCACHRGRDVDPGV